jgi:hypothetical protein
MEIKKKIQFPFYNQKVLAIKHWKSFYLCINQIIDE